MDSGVSALIHRSWALWLLGYPEAALVEAEQALKNAREIGQAATLMYALAHAAIPYALCGDLAAAAAKLKRLSLWPKKRVPSFGRHSEC
jgi:hypothetical protein